MPDGRSPKPGDWSPELGARSPEPGARSPEPGARSLMAGARSLEPGARSLEPGAWSPWSPERGARSLEPGAWSSEPGAWSPEPGARLCSSPAAPLDLLPSANSRHRAELYKSTGVHVGRERLIMMLLCGTLFCCPMGCKSTVVPWDAVSSAAGQRRAWASDREEFCTADGEAKPLGPVATLHPGSQIPNNALLSFSPAAPRRTMLSHLPDLLGSPVEVMTVGRPTHLPGERDKTLGTAQ
ncbi:hypothetical protein DPEC_G00278110 [Dallia pectoralis]|uniref:Uncharacterized protein n=1 Tax=Dallia pectoralis TaxID=75939 RepID=A0ACC2FM22_DALPE|nr:hypothetical protein DPEC_G00278110 [Dallia pectoralis]